MPGLRRDREWPRCTPASIIASSSGSITRGAEFALSSRMVVIRDEYSILPPSRQYATMLANEAPWKPLRAPPRPPNHETRHPPNVPPGGKGLLRLRELLYGRLRERTPRN